MKRASLVIIASLFALASCTNKKDSQIACTAQYVYPSLNFQIVNETDYTMPVYTTTDIYIYLKNDANRTDTISPVLRSASGQKYFSFSVKRAKGTDTCYIQIKNYKLDTLVYTISNTFAPCPQPYISKITINKAPILTISQNAIVQIKK
ncbi:hypothetical protein SAMN05216464_11117 [Mucilaginibacter pineti]|uniref:Lipoprotein n=1 Tax=Mucilaginibacter pineti TaxID=1391627 RepID=A0A1G7H2C4_9SPHI|nr:hypothetical protein [Mucilaginibacter pineti]SDE94289.1 hypothetical protein SAMN05216464_11117 [Mucilaginibacter pineti]